MQAARALVTVLLVVTGAAATILGIHEADRKFFPGCGTVPAAVQAHPLSCGSLRVPAAGYRPGRSTHA